MYKYVALLVVLLACTLFQVHAHAQSIVLVPGTATINVGETRDIDVMMEVPAGLPFQTISVQIQLSANVRVLNGTQGINVNSAVWDLVGQKAIAANLIKFAAASTAGGCENDSCKVMTITLESVSPGPATAQFVQSETLGLTPEDSELGFAEFSDGDYTISGPLQPPILSNITPTNGPIAGNTTVTLTGTSLTGATGVSFGDTPATSVTVVNDTSVTCKSPAHVEGGVQVTVTTPNGTSGEQTFTYNAPIDTDEDGISDEQELELFGDLDETLETDFDGDGISNGTELSQGIDPTLFVGDMNGDHEITPADATRILQFLATMRDEASLGRGPDVSNDGAVTGADATRILQILADLRTQQSVQR